MSEQGLVVARFRGHAVIESQAGERYRCRLQRRSLRPVVGDAVGWRREPDGSGTLEKVEPRITELRRLDARGRPEVVAANLSQLVIVLAVNPAPDWFLLDRYLCAGELAELETTIVYNKMDLVDTLPETLGIYRGLGYPTVPVSARDKSGLSALAQALRAKRSVLIGQSGVGKSSLFNALLGDTLQKVGRLSGNLRQGRHTTTTAVLHRHPSGSELIDSPGVRNYEPYIKDTREVQSGFREFVARRGQCRFADCSHLAEPDCAVKAALAEGEIARRRYENYRKLYEFTGSAVAQRT